MQKIEIDRKKCAKDGICVKICPFHVFHLDKDGFAQALHSQYCIACGQCVAVCPKSAISVNNHISITPEKCLPMVEKLKISPEQALQFLKSRRSVRVYKDELIPNELLKTILYDASWNPSAMDMHPVRWLVVSGKDHVRSLSALTIEWMRKQVEAAPEIAKAHRFDLLVEGWDKGEDMVCRSAPHVIFAFAPENIMPLVVEDCSIALTYLDLCAHAHGIGTCWCGYLTYVANTYGALKQKLPLPQGCKIFGSLLLGYPKFTLKKIPPRQNPDVIWFPTSGF